MHMNKRIAAAALLVLGGTAFNPASAELFTNPAAKSPMGKTQVTGLFGTSSVTYDIELIGNNDADRTFLGASAAYGVSDKLDIYGTFALVTKSEAEDFNHDGDGTAFAFGVRGILPIQADLKMHGYAQYLSLDEDYGSYVDEFGDKVSLAADETVLTLGAVAVKKADNITFYGGAELVLSSDGTATYKDSTFGNFELDSERDDAIGFRVGAVFDAAGLDVNIGLALIHEDGFTLGVSATF